MEKDISFIIVNISYEKRNVYTKPSISDISMRLKKLNSNFICVTNYKLYSLIQYGRII